MVAGRIIGWLLAALALAVLGWEIAASIGAGHYAFMALGSIWAEINANSLVGFNALIEQRISPGVWLDVVLPVLRAPGWLVFGLPALILVLACRRRRRRRSSFS